VKLTPRYAAELAARWGARWRRRADRPHGLVLMYHRVADAGVDPWGLCVSPANFREQMRVLAEMAEPVPLERLTETLRKGRSAKPVVAVTFDDGYLDNLTAAKPVLDEFDIPATVFIATGLTGTTRPLWWDRLANAVLGTGRMPAQFDLRAAEFEFSWQDPRLPGSGRQGERARQRLHRALWAWLRDLPDEARERILEEIYALSGADPGADSGVRPMNLDELHRLAADGRVQLGAHSVSHPFLPSWPGDVKSREIEQSAEQYRVFMGRRPRLFAYPFGGLDDESVAAVRAAGFSFACSLRKDLVWAGDDPLTLPRVPVADMRGAAFRRWLSWYWLP
jgi:peptidoglycan/xylan/chitin deacetylase (PgdA/CDA1 family)